MSTPIQESRTVSDSRSQMLCWTESLILAFGIPASTWVVWRIISVSFPAAVHGSLASRFLFWILGGVIVEWSFVIALWFVVRRRRSSFRDLGVWGLGTWPAWVLALLFAALSIGSNLRFLPQMHIALSNAFLPPGFHLVAALLMGITAGFCEEILFRAFLMTEFAEAGYSKATQVLVPGLAFGLAHAGYLNQGFFVWLGIMLPTAFLGMMWGIAYLLSRRSLVPTIVAHFLNDATALPWVIFFMISAHASEASGSLAPGAPHIEDATQAMIEAITSHQIVMFGETHGNKQEYRWLCDLVKTPAFAGQVDDIVVEFGNSLYQKSVDRYIAGEDVPLEQAQKAWRNMIGAVGPVSPVYGWFYKAVRDSNLAHRGGHKIRLLLGDPYGDWDKINNAEDLGPYVAHRDQWYAEVVKEEVLAHHHRALLIMGAGHFVRRSGPGLVEQAIRAAGVQPYLVVFGTNAVGGYDDLDHRFDLWALPAIVALSGNWVGELPANPVLTGGNVAPNAQKMEDVADAMLYVGPRDALTQVFIPRSELVDTAYGKEIERRLQIQTGHTMFFTSASEGPQYQKPPQQTVSNGIRPLPPNPPKSINGPLPPRPPSQ